MADLSDFVPVGDAEQLTEWYQANVVARYQSNWEFLRYSTLSDVWQTRNAFGQLIAGVREREARGVARAESLFLLQTQWRFLASGPILASITTAAFSLEAFLRVAAEVSLLKQSDGATDLLRLALQGFESRSFLERARMASDLSGAPALPGPIVSDLQSLIQFRNDIAHDAPALQGEDGRRHRIKRGRIKTVEERAPYGGVYPHLSDKMMPLTLRHALRAVQTHDGITTHILENGDTEFTEGFWRVLSPIHLREHRIDSFGGKVWDDALTLADAWETEILPWCDSIPHEEREAFVLDLQRRSNIGLVSQDE